MSLHDHMEMIEKIQYQAALAVTGTWQGTSRVKIYEELGWESLSDRRISRRVLQIYKIIDENNLRWVLDFEYADDKCNLDPDEKNEACCNVQKR